MQKILTNYSSLTKIIDSAKSAEYLLFTVHGETDDTALSLTDLQNVAENATQGYRRLTTIVLRIATIQPSSDQDTMEMLLNTISRVETQIGAWTRSIEEVVTEWSLYE